MDLAYNLARDYEWRDVDAAEFFQIASLSPLVRAYDPEGVGAYVWEFASRLVLRMDVQLGYSGVEDESFPVDAAYSVGVPMTKEN